MIPRRHLAAVQGGSASAVCMCVCVTQRVHTAPAAMCNRVPVPDWTAVGQSHQWIQEGAQNDTDTHTHTYINFLLVSKNFLQPTSNASCATSPPFLQCSHQNKIDHEWKCASKIHQKPSGFQASVVLVQLLEIWKLWHGVWDWVAVLSTLPLQSYWV